MIQKVQFFLTSMLLYILSITMIGYLAYSAHLFGSTAKAELPVSAQTPRKPITSRFVLVSGVPTRIVIPDSGIDLAVDNGYYNDSDGSWTLSKTHAQFAMMTTPANNSSGNTFIYGHGTDEVFGKIGKTNPVPGSKALVYADNGHVFSYVFDSVRNLTPNDTSIFDDYNGPATLTLQTCTGAFSEWRTMFHYRFEKVIK